MSTNETEIRKLSGFVCGACATRYAERFSFCIRCFRTGCCIPDYRRVNDELAPVGRRVTARVLAAEDQQVFELKSMPGLRLQHNAFVIFHGAPSGGKTTGALRVAEELKPSIFVASEMKIGPALGAYLRRLEIRSDRLEIIEPTTTHEIFDAARSGVRAVVIDSLSVMTLLPDDCVSMARAGVIVLGILQHTKAGEAAGSNSWLHAADVVVEFENMGWTVTKSRYQEALVAGDVL